MERPAETPKKPRAKRPSRAGRGRIAAVPPPPADPAPEVDAAPAHVEAAFVAAPSSAAPAEAASAPAEPTAASVPATPAADVSAPPADVAPETVHPGPPPPLPPEFSLDDIVIPPKPPLPAPAVPAAVTTTDAASSVAPPADADTTEAEPITEPVVEAEPTVEPVVEAEPIVETQSVIAAEPDRESGVEAIDDVDVLESVLAEAEAEAEAGAEADAAASAPTALVDRPAWDEQPETFQRSGPDAATIEAAAAMLEAAHGEHDVDDQQPALTLRGVTKSFGSTRAVEGIDLTVPSGTFYGLVGPNGAGKTTTLSMIAGLLRPDRGTVQVAGVDAASDPLAAKRLMGVLPDRLRTFDRLTGRQLLYYYGVLRGLPSAVVERRTADLARAFDLTEALGRVVSDYSAGMAKKVMLAGAMIHSPRVLVLDEPFEAVDPVSSAIILDILSAYVAHGGTVILSSHGMELVQRVCSRVAVLVAGQVLAEGTVDEVRGELTLEQRFVELAGGLSDVEGLEWLHTFSD